VPVTPKKLRHIAGAFVRHYLFEKAEPFFSPDLYKAEPTGCIENLQLLLTFIQLYFS
jgi:hypothetical protein